MNCEAPEWRVLLKCPDSNRGEEQGDARHAHRQIVNVGFKSAFWPQDPLLQQLLSPNTGQDVSGSGQDYRRGDCQQFPVQYTHIFIYCTVCSRSGRAMYPKGQLCTPQFLGNSGDDLHQVGVCTAIIRYLARSGKGNQQVAAFACLRGGTH